ncbi:stage III sporulation protein AH [Bhargavaea cecembensis]|uniref:Stage III sporulation protein AH n=1 Tax=Bhargavaea cecembensis TaxID=394098 RepID=A0A163GFJ6_9BACL|nr:SpoIIIAH-like family protein [Bhargavaea cecembensis]KZE40141.1 stage III sporulation protein AH [Bhargavaea cecembensis]
MRVKKKGVWFLTLLSLVAVIGVYYLFDRNPMPFDGITIFSDDTIKDTELGEAGSDATPVFAESYLFEELRMEMRNERSQQRELLTQKITADDLTAEERDQAFDDMQILTKRETAEAMLEMLIKDLGYEDAVVRTEDGTVKVSVIADELSAAQADQIVYTVKSEWEDSSTVYVDFKSGQ